MGLLSLSLFLALFLITLSFPFLCLTQFLSICSVSVLFAIYRHLPGSFFSVSVMVCLSLSLFLFSATLSGSVSVGLCVSNPPSPPNYPRPPKGNLTLGPPAPPRHPGPGVSVVGWSTPPAGSVEARWGPWSSRVTRVWGCPVAPDPGLGRAAQVAGGTDGSREPGAEPEEGGGPSGPDTGKFSPIPQSSSPRGVPSPPCCPDTF